MRAAPAASKAELAMRAEAHQAQRVIVWLLVDLGGGWLATRFGVPRMLMTGLALQIAGLVMLSGLQPGRTPIFSVAYVVAAQGIAGVAKDLTKTASKSAIKPTSEAAPASSFAGSHGSRDRRMR